MNSELVEPVHKLNSNVLEFLEELREVVTKDRKKALEMLASHPYRVLRRFVQLLCTESNKAREAYTGKHTDHRGGAVNEKQPDG